LLKSINPFFGKKPHPRSYVNFIPLEPSFFSLAELNEKISELLEKLNNKPFQKLEGTRTTHFEALDKPVLRPLPKTAYEFAEWKRAAVSRIISWAKNFGENTGLVVETIIERKQHPVLGYRSSLGIIRLEKSYGRQRLEAASKRALAFGAYSYQSIKSILEKGLDKKPLEEKSNKNVPQNHENVRGSVYYQSQEENVC